MHQRACRGCARPIPTSRTHCPDCQPTPRVRGRAGVNLRHQALALAGYRCERCGSTRYLQVHHRVGLADKGSNELSNFEVLCTDHHHDTHEEQT